MNNIINDQVTEYINRHFRPLSETLSAFRKEAELRRIPIILKDTESFLNALLSMLQPSHILEIGTAVGYSAACFAHIVPTCRIVTIEREESAYQEAVANMEMLGFSDRVTCLKGEAVVVLQQLHREIETGDLTPFDFVFIDAGKSHYAEFLECTMPMTKPRAAIVCDNILMQAKTVSDEYDPSGKHKTNIRRMREFIDSLTEDSRLITALLSIGDGISLSIVKEKQGFK